LNKYILFLLYNRVARYNPGPLEMFDFSYARTMASVDESLARLKVSYIDTMQVHDPEFAPSLDVVVNQTLPALVECVRLGKIRAIGITGYPLDMLRELYKLCVAAGIPVESCLSYSHYCLHDTSLVDSGLLAEFTAAGVGVLNGSPLSMVCIFLFFVVIGYSFAIFLLFSFFFFIFVNSHF
jgi:L-galactose dehydrogenase